MGYGQTGPTPEDRHQLPDLDNTPEGEIYVHMGHAIGTEGKKSTAQQLNDTCDRVIFAVRLSEVGLPIDGWAIPTVTTQKDDEGEWFAVGTFRLRESKDGMHRIDFCSKKGRISRKMLRIWSEQVQSGQEVAGIQNAIEQLYEDLIDKLVEIHDGEKEGRQAD